MAYSEVGALLLGNIPLPAGDIGKRAVERAADEMDSLLGQKYVVPIQPTGPYQRQVKTLLLTINNWLASGRLIEELTASSQGVEIHAYANNLINQALSTLMQIVSGQINLPGVPTVGEEDGVTTQTGPFIINVDDSSPTQYHYDYITNPLFSVQNPDRMLLMQAGMLYPPPYYTGD